LESGPGRFWVAANVGLYEVLNAKAVVPDVFLSLDTTSEQAKEFGSKCYFFWDHGKPPDVVIEIVPNTEGGELDRKLARYAKLHVDHYVIFDPFASLSPEPLQAHLLLAGAYEKRPHAEAFPTVAGLQLQLWEGAYEGQTDRWLRWAGDDGKVIPTGAELAESEALRAKIESQRATLEAQRANLEAQRADSEAKHAQSEAKRANEEAARADAEAKRARVEAARADALAPVCGNLESILSRESPGQALCGLPTPWFPNGGSPASRSHSGFRPGPPLRRHPRWPLRKLQPASA